MHPEDEDCFQILETSDGDTKWKLPTKRAGTYETKVQLPQNTSCHHCVFRWTYVAGNNIHTCPDGEQSTECGPQETFKNCADIAILSKSEDTSNEIPEPDNFLQEIDSDGDSESQQD